MTVLRENSDVIRVQASQYQILVTSTVVTADCINQFAATRFSDYLPKVHSVDASENQQLTFDVISSAPRCT